MASLSMAGDKYMIIGINKDATNHDKLKLLSVINKYLDPDYTAGMTITIYKVSNPSVEALVGCWDIGGRFFPFTKAQALNYFTNHAADFDNVNAIKLMAADDGLQAIADAGFAIKE